MATVATTEMVASQRDIRLDFFRGIAMFIILIAHIPWNFLALWIPARFGFSDATEIFVFCSGMASAIAFGKAFRTKGWFIGTARVLYRVWQVYWAHIAVFLIVASFLTTIDSTGAFEKVYSNAPYVVPFFDNTVPNLLGLLTLTYVPNYFDILPMYIAILVMMPIVVALHNLHSLAALVFVVLVWIGANADLLWMPAEPWSDREWFFNPFGWQLIFFTGFAFMAGWLPAPPLNKWLVVLAIVIVLATIPFAYFRILKAVPELKEASAAIQFFKAKTDFGIFRYVHFLALAYLGWAAAGPAGDRLRSTGTSLLARIWQTILKCILKVGQQSLAVFVFSMVAARIIGFVLDLIGRTTLIVWLANLVGFALIVGVAYLAAWFKSQPWRNTPEVRT